MGSTNPNGQLADVCTSSKPAPINTINLNSDHGGTEWGLMKPNCYSWKHTWGFLVALE